MYDAIVVGARCAGASTAMLLARTGHRVLLVDRSTFPSDMRLSNHLVWQPGIAHLRRWGLLDRLVDTGRRPMEVALAGYERRRNTAVMPMYEFTDATAALQPPTPQSQALFASFREDRAQFERFLGVFAGTVPVQAFFPAPAPQRAA